MSRDRESMRRRLLIATLALCCGALVSSVQAATPARQPTVLVLSADSLGYPNLAAFFSGFRETLQQDLPVPARIHTESVDVSLFASPAHRVRLAEWYRSKYRDVRPDAILVMGHAALQFLVASELWPGVPTYFAMVGKHAIRDLVLPANVTGQTIGVNLGGMVALARQLFPDTTTLALVGNRPEADSYRPFYAPELAALQGRIRFLDLRGMRYETLAARLAALPPHTVIYHTTLNDDGSGRVFEPRVALAALTRVANRPTLVDVATAVGLGPVGGRVFLPVARGRESARQVMRLLGGTAPATLPVTSSEFPAVFDWRQLQRWQVPDARLAPGSELRFYQPTLWQQYRVHVAVTLLIIASLSALSVALLVERRRRAVAVAQSRRRLAEIAHMNRNATASVYSAAIAHELNQPLAAILSNAETAEILLGRAAPPLDELRAILADIQRDDRRASDLIARMRNLLKPSEANSRVADMNAIVRDALTFIASEATLRRTLVRTELTGEAAPVLVDPVQMQQVLINLVLNSLDAVGAMPESARIITVSTALTGKEQIEVAVRDTGTGFDANIEHVFESFFTTKAHGMGLGLSITAAIVQSHGGTISASDAAGGGACVRFQLPLKGSA